MVCSYPFSSYCLEYMVQLHWLCTNHSIMASKNGQKLPSTERAWGEWATLHNVKNSTIHDVRLSSASTIEEEQYLMLRVLWIVSSPSRLNMRQFDLEEWHTQAKELLRGSKAWLKYFNAFDSKEIPEGSFAMAKKYQQQALQTNDSTLRPSVQFTPPRTRSQMGHMTDKMRELVLRTPTKSTGTLEDSDDEQIPPSSAASSFYTPGPEEISRLMYPQTEDEQIVNIALVDFLNALTVHFPHAKDWSIHRKSFKATFQHASFEARTDGYLEDRTRGSRVRALLEVKPMIRRDKQAAIRMQEAAQMVAWIKTDPDINGFLSRRGRYVTPSHYFVSPEQPL